MPDEADIAWQMYDARPPPEATVPDTEFTDLANP
jgi:hypothetical protein